MFRAFLYQLASKDGNVLKRLDTLHSTSELDLTDKNKLLDVINETKEATVCNICFFIDGLDEYEKSKTELVHTIQRLENILKGRIKICLAGRSEPDLGRILRDYPTFRMQDYNKSTMNNIIQYHIKLEAEKNINFTSIPAANRKEGSFFLFLVQDFEDSEHSLDLIWGACDICRESFQTFIPSLRPGGEISNKNDLETRMKRLLPNLLDVSCTLTFDGKTVDDKDLPLVAEYAESLGINELPSTVRYVHETLRSYLDKSDFISQHLPIAFKEQYSICFHLQLYAQVLEKASKDEIIPPASLKKCTTEILSISSAFQTLSFKSQASAVAYIVKWCLGLRFLKGIHTATLCKLLFPEFFAIVLTDINRGGRLGRILGGPISLILRKLTNSFPIPPNWRAHFVTLRTAFLEILPLSSAFERNESCSSYPMIHGALSSYLSQPMVDIVSAIEGIFYPRLQHQTIDQSLSRYHADLLLAVSFQLNFYLRDSLANHTAEEIDWLISFAIVKKDETRLTEILPILTSNRVKMGLHHVCLVLQDTTGLFGERLGKLRAIIRHLPDTASQRTRELHHKCCKSDNVNESLIFDWARISSDLDVEIKDGELEEILKFLVSTGADINAPSHNGETPLHAIFNNDINPLHEILELGVRKLAIASNAGFEILKKLVALAKLGADPERTGPPWQCAGLCKTIQKKTSAYLSCEGGIGWEL